MTREEQLLAHFAVANKSYPSEEDHVKPEDRYSVNLEETWEENGRQYGRFIIGDRLWVCLPGGAIHGFIQKVCRENGWRVIAVGRLQDALAHEVIVKILSTSTNTRVPVKDPIRHMDLKRR